MPSTPFTTRRVTANDIVAIQALAHRIWHQHYPGIISREQIDYMLGLWYSAPALAEQIAEPSREFLLAEQEGEPIAYSAAKPTDDGQYLFIHKLYVDESARGIGVGSHIIEHFASLAGSRPLQLRVNRHNVNSIRFYKKHGFAITGEDILDIGHGYIMDDYMLVRSPKAK